LKIDEVNYKVIALACDIDSNRAIYEPIFSEQPRKEFDIIDHYEFVTEHCDQIEGIKEARAKTHVYKEEIDKVMSNLYSEYI